MKPDANRQGFSVSKTEDLIKSSATISHDDYGVVML